MQALVKNFKIFVQGKFGRAKTEFTIVPMGFLDNILQLSLDGPPQNLHTSMV